MRLWLAVQCFFKLLVNADFARQVRQLVEGAMTQTKPGADSGKSVPAATEKVIPQSNRSDAITLLATLQREARFVDIMCEQLDGYSDAQIGAAARDVLRESGKVINRMFSLKPVVDAEEGKNVEVPASYDTAEYRLTGNVTGGPPFSGVLTHAGWQATTCELPAWTGGQQASLVIAPAEIQIP